MLTNVSQGTSKICCRPTSAQISGIIPGKFENLDAGDSIEIEIIENLVNSKNLIFDVDDQYQLTVPLILGEDSEPEVKFDPSSIFLELAPLNTAVTASFKIISSDLSPKVKGQIIRN